MVNDWADMGAIRLSGCGGRKRKNMLCLMRLLSCFQFINERREVNVA